MKEFAKTFVKKTFDEKDFLTLRLREKKITKAQVKYLRTWLNACIAQFSWEPAEEKSE